MAETVTTVLVIHGRAIQARSEWAVEVTRQVSALDVRLREITETDENVAVFATLRTASPTGIPVLVVTDPDVEHPFRCARRIVRDLPEVRFLFVVVPEREAGLKRDAVFGAPPGNRWQLTTARGDSLAEQIATSIASGQQSQRLRTTVDRMKLRLSAQTPVDSIEYRRLVVSERYLASVLQNAQDAIVSLNPAGSVVAWNRGAQLMFGIAETQARSRPLADLFDEPSIFEAAAATALATGGANATLQLSRQADVRSLEANLDCLVDDDAKAAGLVVILRDVTERVRSQARLLEGSRQKDEFLAMLSHELRNPLAPIRTAADLLQLIESKDPRTVKASAIISRQVAHMTALIDDLLDVARVTRGTVVLDKMPLAIVSVISEAVEQTNGLFEAKRQRLTVSTPGDAGHIEGDRKRLTQVLVNLLSNSAKFTPEGGHISIDLAATASSVAVTVADDGVGIEPELLPHVFDLFVQGPRSPERALGGLGIGLALVRLLIELHGGKVSVRSAGAGSGTAVRLELPKSSRRSETPASTPNAAGAKSSLDLLVVDDNEDAATTLATLLETLGHRVETYTDPREALKRLSEPLPAAMILDIGMPHIDGYELAKHVRATEGADHLVLIALTGYGQASDREKAMAAGFDHHLVKPVDIEALNEILGRVKLRANGS